ncbi:hypothetical protein PV328_010446 [Microctonus aethiopoides]|uniref:PHD-type domain-containing protein n=1 Tax=Microctonus aethiopoides TaxID=144406 RepID=A0AA39FI10_9HYME|nr:hypothetical protein PV328_010446 [Microctonus aethiopoides]
MAMAEYSRGILKIVVAQICQIIGWHSINSTPLEFMVDLMQEYLLRIARVAHQYAEILGRTDPNLDDLGLAFQQMNVDINQLAEYVKNVDSVPCVISVPKLPISHDNHLNFLKPGSKEVVTRPVHVHEHLPAMNLEQSSDELDEVCNNENINTDHPIVESIESHGNLITNEVRSDAVFKRPGNPLSEQPGTSKRAKVIDESRPLREIHSVMMTTSGFLSPAREGKLPESRTPAQARADSPSPSSYPMVPPELKCDKKIKKLVKKGSEDRKLDKENRKKNREKDLFKPDKVIDTKMKTLSGTKDASKSKSVKAGGSKTLVIIPPSAASDPQHHPQKEEVSGKISKKSSPKLKSEKVASSASAMHSVKQENSIKGKLPVELDKQKLNIFKKISKSRDEKNSEIPEHHKFKDTELQSSTSGSILDEADKFIRNDPEIKLEETKTSVMKEEDIFLNSEITESRSPSSDMYAYDDMSPPGTPSTPKTPELNVPGCPTDQKKKRKEKSSRKKDNMKTFNSRDSIMKIKSSSETPDTDVLGRPKTPDASESSLRKDSNVTSPMTFPFFPPFPSAPGLIPMHSMFPRFPLPLPRGAPNQPSILQNMPAIPRFLPPTMNTTDGIPMTKGKLSDRDSQSIVEFEKPISSEPYVGPSKIDVEKSCKMNKMSKQHNDSFVQQLEMQNTRNEISASIIPMALQQSSQKLIKSEKIDKKSKKHKIEKKEKLKKKKEKKEKHKEKSEKNKEKKEKMEKFLKVKERKERKDKRKDKDKEEKESEAVPKITLKLGTASPTPPMLETSLMKKITIKPLIKKVEDTAKRESSPELAKISALVTRPPKQKTARAKQEVLKKSDLKEEKIDIGKSVMETTSAVIDQGGQQVWICPACGNQDDGSPMVGCDDCDAWYHWVCVGMQVPPATSENWYCRLCISKKQGQHHDKKKKKRKKRVKIVS